MCLSIASMTAFAEPQNKSHKPPTPEQEREFREFKLKYLAQEMELKDDQKDRFFELYDKMMKEKRQSFEKVHPLEKKVRSGKNVSDEDYDRLSEAMNEARRNDVAIDSKYEAEFAKFLSKKQIYKFREAEGRFRDKMKELRGPGRHHKNKKKKETK